MVLPIYTIEILDIPASFRNAKAQYMFPREEHDRLCSEIAGNDGITALFVSVEQLTGLQTAQLVQDTGLSKIYDRYVTRNSLHSWSTHHSREFHLES